MGVNVVVLCSGGLDSVTLCHSLAQAGHTLDLLAVNYGQRHRKEITCARACADRLGARCDVVQLGALASLLSGRSALTNPQIPVPEGHYAHHTMRDTVVPNRNSILLSIAVGVAIARGAQAVATAVHAGDHAIYPDCRPAFITHIDRLVQVANEGFGPPRVWAPFVESTKTDIARLAGELDVPIAQTWSCYGGGEQHCARCGTCYERVESLALAGVLDPTPYADEVFAEQVRTQARQGAA